MSGIIDIVVNKNSKVNANTKYRKSDQSKIVPKNTNDSLEMPQGIEKDDGFSLGLNVRINKYLDMDLV